MKRHAAVLLEGSSSATGLFDEGRRGGFTGRIESHYDAYNEMSCLGVKQDPYWVFVHRNGQPDLQPCEIASSLGNHYEDIRRRPVSKVLGIFVIGIQSDYDAYRFGEEKALAKWVNGLGKLSDALTHYPVESLFMTSPKYSIDTPLGIEAVHNPELRKTYLSYLKALAFEKDAPLVSFEHAMGGTLADYGALDQKHVKAQGHERIADFLLPLLDYKLGISNDPAAEERLRSSTIKTGADFLIH